MIFWLIFIQNEKDVSANDIVKTKDFYKPTEKRLFEEHGVISEIQRSGAEAFCLR